MTQGFITIATGNIKYYAMARTLLRSYRQTSDKPMKFAILADRHNEYTQEFDDVVILEHPACSWMDKMQLLQNCPYDENIFIDADCIVYRNINHLWEIFKNADDFSCFGMALPLDDKSGWFTSETAKMYPIKFITHLHGIMYYIRKGKKIDEMADLCRTLIDNYNSVTYRAFNDVLADEPVYALAMAILNLKPSARKPSYYCFVPYATEIYTNYYTKHVRYSNPTDGTVNGCDIVHWGNKNTDKCKYRFDADVINYINDNGDINKPSFHNTFLYRYRLLYCWYLLEDKWLQAKKFIAWFFERVWAKLTKRDS